MSLCICVEQIFIFVTLHLIFCFFLFLLSPLYVPCVFHFAWGPRLLLAPGGMFLKISPAHLGQNEAETVKFVNLLFQRLCLHQRVFKMRPLDGASVCSNIHTNLFCLQIWNWFQKFMDGFFWSKIIQQFEIHSFSLLNACPIIWRILKYMIWRPLQYLIINCQHHTYFTVTHTGFL